MTVTPIRCPLCNNTAAASDIGGRMRARVYCETCRVFDITRMALDELAGAPPAHLAELSRLAREAPEGQILVMMRERSGGARYEPKTPKADRPAPEWLPSA